MESGARYLGPLRLDEVVELRQVLEALGKRSFRSRMDVLGTGGQLVVQARSHLVWTEKDARGVPRACPLPDWLQAALLDPPATTTAVPA